MKVHSANGPKKSRFHLFRQATSLIPLPHTASQLFLYFRQNASSATNGAA